MAYGERGIISLEEFPPGTICHNCDMDMPPGTPYVMEWMGMAEEVPVMRLICEDCSERPHDYR